MIIKELNLNNFISYERATIQFPKGVTVIVGENGAGKTTILDAITYALCKKHSRDKDENLVRHRFNEASIRLKFSVRGKTYEAGWNIARRRAANGYLKDLDEDRPLVRPGAGEKTILPEIMKILGLSEDVFMNAIYVKQGEITRLIDLRSSERKRLIAQLLGIEVLEKIWEAMRDPIRDLDAEIDNLSNQINQLEQLQKELQNKEKELSKKRVELQNKEKQKTELESLLQYLKKQLEELKSKKKRYDELKERISMLKNEKVEKEAQKSRTEEKLSEWRDAYKRLIEYAPLNKEKELKEKEIASRRQEKDELQKTLSKILQKEEEKKLLIYEKQSREEQIKREFDKFDFSRLVDFNKLISGEVDISEVKEIHSKECNNVKEELERVKRIINVKNSEIRKYSSLKMLTVSVGVISIILSFTLLGINMISYIIPPTVMLSIALIVKSSSSKQKAIENDLSYLQTKRDELMRREDNLKKFEIGKISEWLNEVNQCREKIMEIEKENLCMERLKTKIESLDQEIKKLEKRLEELEQYSNEYVKAQGVLEREGLKDPEELNENIKQLEQDADRLERGLSKISAEISQVEEEIKRLDYHEEEYESTQNKYDDAMSEKGKIEREIGGLEGEIKRLSEDIEKLREKLRKLGALKNACKELQSYRDSLDRVREFFSKDGPLQKAVRRRAALLIEEYARQLLQEFNLPFFDLRIDENFDVKVYGQNGEQTIETLSGGERVAIALVLRLSIAAALAGEALELIIMDEPTIHLDSERRKELVNMLKNFKEGTRMIAQLIIVSHDRELEEAADQIYEVIRSGGVSKIKQYTT
ncbi:MAG: AAA family ATPase [Candidatus Bathyarchaeia archaeon]